MEPASEEKPQSDVAIVASELDDDDDEAEDKSESPAAAAASALVNIFALVV